MNTVCKKLLSLTLVAMLLVSAVPFQAFAAEVESVPATEAVVETVAATEAPVVETAPATEAPVVETTVATEAPVVETTAATEAPVVETTAATEAPVVETTAATEAPVVETTAPTVAPETTTATEATETEPTETMAPSAGTTVPSPEHTVIMVTDGGLLPGGNLNSVFYHGITIGQPYGYHNSLPTPTRTNYDFVGWYGYSSGKPINNSTIATSNEMLLAKWTLTSYNVQFQRFDLNLGDWVNVENYNIKAFSTVTTDNGFPTTEEINANYNLPYYTIVGWEIGTSDEAFHAGLTQITKDIVVRPRYQRTVELNVNNPAGYTSSSSKYITVEIGESIGVLPHPGARDGFAFVDWVAQDMTTVISTKANLSNTKAHPLYNPAVHGSVFYARYEESTRVTLFIHTNGNTQTATKVVYYYDAPTKGAFDTRLINMYEIFSDYGYYDDSNDVAYGWYDATQWKNYCANTAANKADVFYNIAENGYTELHIMLINGGASSTGSSSNNYNTNTSTADKTNPTTGDYIFMAVTVLALSAAALTVIFFMKKRKTAK